MAVKCNIASLALQNLNLLRYGFNCQSVTCKIVENYIEYLNCPTVDFQPCTKVECDPTTEIVECSTNGLTLTISTVTVYGATVSFPLPEYEFSLVLMQGASVVSTIENPVSPYTYTGLDSGEEYTVRLVVNCPFGETVMIEEDFNTLLACVTITDFVGIATVE